MANEMQKFATFTSQKLQGAVVPQTMLEKFYHWESVRPQSVFMRQPINGTYRDYTWWEVGQQARKMVTALQSMGLPQGTNIGIVSKNCAHWIMADLAIQMAGYVSVPFYPSLVAEQLNLVLNHSQTKVLFVGKLDVWQGMKAGIPESVRCIAFPPYPGNDSVEEPGFDRWDDLIAQYEPSQRNYVPDLQDLATIIYTSGTTGNPKGVMNNYYNSAVGMAKGASYLEVNSPDCRFFSYMPMCHIAERALVEGGCIYSGGTIYFAESLDTFAKNLQDCQPTHFLAVPRIWTKFQLGILSKMSQKKLNNFLKIPILSGIIKKKIRKGLGLSQAKVILTGAAPMPASLLDWYKKLGINIQEVYGMTENGGACTIMPKLRNKIGTVGKPYDYVSLKIDPTNGEVLMKSDLIMQGYYREPEMTAETIDTEGWLHTGDMGEIDAEGYLKLTGRVKEMFKTAKGEYVAPGPIEWKFATNNDIEQIAVMGSGLPQPVALVVLSDIGKAKSPAEVKAGLLASLKIINPELVPYQRLHQIIVCREAWTVDNGLLTPTLKTKRNFLEKKYQTLMEVSYEKNEQVIFE
ncbi:MAG: AMP-binding protein [Microscillaceae bacterium]|jgi:long-subunit acyl-CoA synthetase (AMP-forming)|nr:AMP-binding protein [Microscillaceae bacterium]